MKYTPTTEITVVNGPTIEDHLQGHSFGEVIYSISLSNGLVITSPAGFEAVASPPPKRRPAAKRP